MVPFSWVNWTENDSVQAAENEGGWQTGRICFDWRISNAQPLYHRNKLFCLFCSYVSDWRFYHLCVVSCFERTSEFVFFV